MTTLAVPPDRPVARSLSRRNLLRGGAGLAVVAATGGGLLATRRAAAADVSASLLIRGGLALMIDGKQVFVIGYSSTADRVEVPGGVLHLVSGDRVTLQISNALGEPHAFTVPGVVDSGPIPAGATRTVAFTAPEPGTYLYSDRLRGAVNRSLGLYGVMVVMPAGVTDRPYEGAPTFTEQFSWVFSEIDPVWGEKQRLGQPIAAGSFRPKYFTINGRSGLLSVKDERIAPHGKIGEAALIRMTNAGQAPKSIHFHGNHVAVLRHPQPWLNGSQKDTLTVPPNASVDVLLRFEAPRDAYPPVTRGQRYPVHDHVEMTQTAGGGLYPSGLVSDWVLE